MFQGSDCGKYSKSTGYRSIQFNKIQMITNIIQPIVLWFVEPNVHIIALDRILTNTKEIIIS